MNDDEPAEFRPPERFSITRKIGAGGMGVVYEAIDRSRDMRVALKTLPMGEPARLYRFKQEFRNFTDVSHPNLAPLYELVSDGETWFFTMELIEGVSFLQYVRSGFDDPEEGEDVTSWVATSIHHDVNAATRPIAFSDMPPLSTPEQFERLRGALRQLAEGVSAIHEAGRLHRDLKPSNVLVSKEGRVVILDFGLSMTFQSAIPDESEEGQISGTAAYMSPEQASAGAVQTPATDWYSVGVMMYEALSGLLPFTGSAWRMLHDKMNLDPPPLRNFVDDVPPDLEELCMSLIRRNPTDRPSGDEVLRRLGGTGATATLPREAALIGRSTELELLEGAFEAARSRRTVVAFVHGSSGVGKSYLVNEFLGRLARVEKSVVLLGRCFEAESVPYKALDSTVDALARYLRNAPFAGEIVPRDVHALIRLFPVLRQVEAFERAPQPAAELPNPLELRRRAVGALHELLAALAERVSLVVCIDDLQWGDVDSANLLIELLRPPRAPRLLLLGVYRSEYESTSAPLRMLLDATLSDGATSDRLDLSVGALEQEEARSLAMALLGGNGEIRSRKAEAIARESSGIPFFIHEMARFMLERPETDAAPGSIEVSMANVLERRFATLSPPAHRLLELISVLGRPARRGDIFRASHLAAEDRAAFTALRGSFMIRSSGPADEDVVEVYHDRIRETMAAQLAPGETAAHYALLGATLESSGGYDSETLAICFRGAGEPAKASEYYATAARQAAEALAFERAANLYRTAIELRPDLDRATRSDLEEKLGEALANGGRAAEAAQLYEQAMEGAEPARAVELLRHAAFHYCSSGRLEQGRVALERLLRSQQLSLPRPGITMLLSLLASRFHLWLRGLRFQETAESAIAPGVLTRIDVTWSASAGLSMMDIIAGATFQTRNLILALAAGEPYRIARALAWEAAHTSNSGSDTWPRTRELLDAALGLASSVGHPHAVAMATMARGIAEFTMGRWHDAFPLLDEAGTMFRDRCTGVTWERDTANAFKLWALVYQGEFAEMATRTRVLMEEAGERGDLYASTNLESFMLPHARLAADDVAGAREAVRSSQERWNQSGFHLQHLTSIMSSTLIDLYEGNGASAFARIDGSWKRIEGAQILRIQVLRVFLRHFHARSALEMALSATDAAPLLRAAARDAAAIGREGAPWARPMAETLRAAIASHSGDRERAAELLGLAAAEFERGSMWSYAAAATRRRGELLGDEASIGSADAMMRSRGVENPKRMASMHLAGLRI